MRGCHSKVQATCDQLRELAVKAEDVISVENQGWMARLAEDPPEQRTATADNSPAK